jgi:predicted metal-dependent HD superfamily phosphohydrolase
VRKEYAHVPDAGFAAGRAAVVGQLLELDPLFHTGTGRRLWQRQARENLAAEQLFWRRPAAGGVQAGDFRTA